MYSLNPTRLVALFGWSLLLMGIGPFSCENSAVNTANELTLEQLKTPVVVKEPPEDDKKSSVEAESVDAEEADSVSGQTPQGYERDRQR